MRKWFSPIKTISTVGLICLMGCSNPTATPVQATLPADVLTLLPTAAVAASTPLAPTGTPAPLPVTYTLIPTLQPSATADLVENLVADATPASLATGVAPTATPRPTRQPEATGTLSADDPAFSGTSINELTLRNYGGEFVFTDTITQNDEYLQFTFEYTSDGETVEGFLTLPAGTGEFGETFPVLMLLHGYINPDEYEIFPYTERYVMPFVDAGYMVIHPSYRGHPPKPNSDWDNVFRIEYAIDVLNLMAIVREGSNDPAGPFRRADVDNFFLWGHSMGGGIAQRVMAVRPKWVSGVALYASMSGDEARNYERIRKWGDERTWRVEYFAPPEVIARVSPINYLDRWEAPVTIHHGDVDEVVPPEWSRELCDQLKARRHPVECHEYYNYRHNLYGAAEEVFTARVIAFFERYQR